MVGTRTFAEALPDSYSSDPEFEPARRRSVATGAPSAPHSPCSLEASGLLDLCSFAKYYSFYLAFSPKLKYHPMSLACPQIVVPHLFIRPPPSSGPSTRLNCWVSMTGFFSSRFLPRSHF